MRGYGPESYGDHFADVYDEWYGDVTDIAATVAGVAALAAGGPVLELGVGTGRLAVPLAEDGTEVVGVDASRHMLDRLRDKVGGPAVGVVLGDMADLPVAPGRFGLAFAAFNTFFNLTDADAQRRCAEGVHRALRPGGAFVIEGFVPPAEGLADHGMTTRELPDGRVVVTASVHDGHGQRIRGQHLELSVDGARERPWVLHYRTPAQLDELLVGIGFAAESRWADWSGRPFDDGAETHVSVYRRA